VGIDELHAATPRAYHLLSGPWAFRISTEDQIRNARSIFRPRSASP